MRGATLLETIVAMAVLALALAPLTGAVANGWRAQALALNQRRVQEEVERAGAAIADGLARGGARIGGLRAASYVCADTPKGKAPCSGALVFLVPRPVANQVVGYYVSRGTLYRYVCTLGEAGCSLDRAPAAGGSPVLSGVVHFSAVKGASDPRLVHLALDMAGQTRAAFRWETEVRVRNAP